MNLQQKEVVLIFSIVAFLLVSAAGLYAAHLESSYRSHAQQSVENAFATAQQCEAGRRKACESVPDLMSEADRLAGRAAAFTQIAIIMGGVAAGGVGLLWAAYFGGRPANDSQGVSARKGSETVE